MVESQTTNSIHGPSFGHNLSFRCPNGWCKPILDIYVLRDFPWYKKLFNPLSFDPYNCLLKIWKSTRTPTPNVGVPVGLWRSIPSHSLALPRACGMTPGLPSWPATLQPFALVVSPRLGLRHNVYWEVKYNSNFGQVIVLLGRKYALECELFSHFRMEKSDSTKVVFANNVARCNEKQWRAWYLPLIESQV
jgi:hypothetical protein